MHLCSSEAKSVESIASLHSQTGLTGGLERAFL